ncbi:hypothetical protein WJX74_002890 [Apatococcus lobatus]|uniref:F-box/LRR-repeat protein 15-like leucin rich repeat domain-containing protein n=1 Tax=Apatococcus lobatus TaxID=904363 RepID=A0AAW1RV57_9CHLO
MCEVLAPAQHSNLQDTTDFVHQFSGSSFHAALELLDRLRGLGIGHGSDHLAKSLVLAPDTAAKARRAQLTQKQLAFAVPCRRKMAATSWSHLPTDLLLQTFCLEGMADAPLLRAALACRSWQSALGRFTQRLSFTWCSQQSLHQVDDVVRGAALSFRYLQDISLRRCSSLTDDALSTLLRSQHRPHQVRVLDLSSCHQLTDSGLGSLVWQGRSLTHLHLSSCAELSDRTFAVLGQCCPGLEHLGACGCERITDSGLIQLTQGARKLKMLNLGWCEALTDVGIASISEHCQDLLHLDLCGCLKVGDMGVQTLASLRSLQSLSLHCCRRITDDGLAPLAATLTTLLSLNLSGCCHVTSRTVQALVDANPGLHTCRSMDRTILISGCLALEGVTCHCRRPSLDRS